MVDHINILFIVALRINSVLHINSLVYTQMIDIFTIEVQI